MTATAVGSELSTLITTYVPLAISGIALCFSICTWWHQTRTKLDADIIMRNNDSNVGRYEEVDGIKISTLNETIPEIDFIIRIKNKSLHPVFIDSMTLQIETNTPNNYFSGQNTLSIKRNGNELEDIGQSKEIGLSAGEIKRVLFKVGYNDKKLIDDIYKEFTKKYLNKPKEVGDKKPEFNIVLVVKTIDNKEFKFQGINYTYVIRHYK